MNAIEFLKTPFYISQFNMVMPVTKINLGNVNIYSYVATPTRAVIEFISVLAYTSAFMAEQLLKIVFVEANTDMVLYIMCVFTVFMFLVLNDQKNKLNEQTEQIESLENRINYLKKMERMREEMDEMWIQDIKMYQQETTKKIVTMDRKLKKLEKDLKAYE